MVIRHGKSKKNRQHNDQKDKQRSTKHTHKTKDNINIVPRTDLQVDGMEAMWFEIKSKVGNILLNIIYRSQIEPDPFSGGISAR